MVEIMKETELWCDYDGVDIYRTVTVDTTRNRLYADFHCEYSDTKIIFYQKKYMRYDRGISTLNFDDLEWKKSILLEQLLSDAEKEFENDLYDLRDGLENAIMALIMKD